MPNHRPVPLLALWLDVDPAEVADAQAGLPPRGTYLRPRTAQVARDYILDRRDRDRRVPPARSGFTIVGANSAWITLSRC